MRPNTTKRLLADGRPALGLFVSSASPLAAEIVGGLDLDWTLIDLQHGENEPAGLGRMLQALSATETTPFVRVPVNDPTLIGRALDLGAYGIVVPLVGTPDDAAMAVRASTYPPAGARSWGPIRGALYGGSDYFTGSAAETLLFVMLETAEGVARAREILAVPGVDGCYVGLNDLSIALGLLPEGASGAELPGPVEEALAAIIEACRVTGKVPGIQLYGAEAVNRRLRQGFRFIGLGTELRIMRGAVAAMLGAIER